MPAKEFELDAQNVGVASSAFVDVVVATGAAEQFGPQCPARDLERSRNGRNAVCLGDDEQEGHTHACASHGPTPREAEQRSRGYAIVPSRPNCPCPIVVCEFVALAVGERCMTDIQWVNVDRPERPTSRNRARSVLLGPRTA